MISIISHFSVALLLSFQLVTSTSFYPLKIGQDPQAGYSDNDILRGFKLNVAEGENPLKDRAFDGDIIVIPFSSTYDRSNLIQSYKDAEESMAISGSLGVTYKMAISGKASATYLQNTKSSKNEATITYRLRRVAYAKKVDTSSLTPTEELNGLLNADTIAEKYGTKFIDQILYGAQLDIDFKFSSADERYIQEIGAQLQGEINLKAIQIDFDAEFGLNSTDTESSLQVEITASSSGLPDYSIPANPSFDDALAAIDDFQAKYVQLVEEAREEEQVDSMENVLKKFSPVGFSLSSISDYQPALSKFETAALESKMADLSDVFYSTLYLKEQLIATRDRQKAIYTDLRDKSLWFNPYSEEVDRVIDILDKKVDECLDYQRLPMAEIIGRVGDATVPASDAIHRDLKDGLLGFTFLPSDVTILNTEFVNKHYVGYGLSVDGIMKPWLSGSLRDASYVTIARANTPDKLEDLAKEKIDFDESKVRINTKVNNDERRFILNKWTGNLESFEITGSLPFEYKAYVEDLGNLQDWKSSGFVGNPTNTPKFMKAFAIKIDGTQHSVSYAAQIEHPSDGIITTRKFRDGEVCCIRHGENECLEAPIKSIFVSIETHKQYAPCKTSSLCICEDSICHDATETTSHAPSAMPSIYPTSFPTRSMATRPPTLNPTPDPTPYPTPNPTPDPTPAPTNPPTPQLVFGDIIYLKNNGLDSRWLSGARSSGNEQVVTRDFFKSSYEQERVAGAYQWIVQRSAQSIGRSGCVAYGNIIYLRNNFKNERWLSGARSSGNEQVVSRDYFSTSNNSYEQKKAGRTYQWIVQKSARTTGSGCVRPGDSIYLRNNGTNNRWLSGGRGSGNEQVVTRNLFSTSNSSYEQNKAGRSYQWTVQMAYTKGDLPKK